MKINDKHLAHFATSKTTADLKGWLWKKGELNTSYQKRWCVLKGNLLFYFEKKSDKEPIGFIVLENYFVQLSEGGDSPYTFSIHFNGVGSRVYKLTADDEAKCNSWIQALMNCSYRHLKILVDCLERDVNQLERKKGVQPSSSTKQKAVESLKSRDDSHLFADNATSSSTSTPKHLKHKHCRKKNYSNLKKSRSMPSVFYDNETIKAEESDFYDFNIFADESETVTQKLSKSHDDLLEAVDSDSKQKSHKPLNKKNGLSKLSNANLTKKKQSYNLESTKSPPQTESNQNSTNCEKKRLDFLTLHEQFRNEIDSFISESPLIL